MIIIAGSYGFDSIGTAEVSKLTRNQTQVDSINGYLISTQSRYVRWLMSYQLVCDREQKELLEQLYAELLGNFNFTDHRLFSWLTQAGTDDDSHAYSTGALFAQGTDINGTPQQGNGYFACNQTWLIPVSFVVSARGLKGNTANVVGGDITMFRETPAGTINGTNPTFVLSQTPTTTLLFKNGQEQKVGSDYNISGSVITFIAGAIPNTGAQLDCYYTL